MIQATSGRRGVSRDGAAVVDALYEVAVATRRLSGRDRIDTGSVRLLWHVAEVGSCRLSDLAEAAGLDLSTVSRHVRDLVDAGYAVRTADERDRRAVVIELTHDGRELLDETRASRAAALTPVLESWDAADRADLTRLLTALARDLTSAAPGRSTTDSEEPA
ncbi:MAG: MarR family transcriptional regulator [Candidatus Nanopelagicales bacterium]